MQFDCNSPMQFDCKNVTLTVVLCSAWFQGNSSTFYVERFRTSRKNCYEDVCNGKRGVVQEVIMSNANIQTFAYR